MRQYQIEENNKLIYDSTLVFGSAFRALVTDTTNEDNLTVVVRLAWTKTAEDGTVNSFYEDIILNEALVSSIVGANGQKSFRITLTGYENYENLTFQTIVMSGTEAISHSAILNAPVATVSE